MFKTLTAALVALALLAGVSMPAAAQDDDAPLQLEDLDGIERAISRTFFVDLMDIAAEATPGASQDDWLGLITMAIAFDSEDAAAQAVPRLIADLERADFAGEGGTTETIQLDIERDHVANLITTDDDVPATILVAIAQDGAFIDIVIGATQGADPEPVVTTTLAAMGETDATAGEELFRADGTSQGGLWDRLPTLEQAEVSEFVEATDEILYPDPSAPVISTPARVTVPAATATPAT